MCMPCGHVRCLLRGGALPPVPPRWQPVFACVRPGCPPPRWLDGVQSWRPGLVGRGLTLRGLAAPSLGADRLVSCRTSGRPRPSSRRDALPPAGACPLTPSGQASYLSRSAARGHPLVRCREVRLLRRLHPLLRARGCVRVFALGSEWEGVLPLPRGWAGVFHPHRGARGAVPLGVPRVRRVGRGPSRRRGRGAGLPGARGELGSPFASVSAGGGRSLPPVVLGNVALGPRI